MVFFLINKGQNNVNRIKATSLKLSVNVVKMIGSLDKDRKKFENNDSAQQNKIINLDEITIVT